MRTSFRVLLLLTSLVLLVAACAPAAAPPPTSASAPATAPTTAAVAPTVAPVADPDPEAVAESSPVPVADPDPEAVSTTGAAVASAAPAATSAAAPSTLSGDLVVYSARKEELLQPLLDAFKQRYPDVVVTVKSGAAGELGQLITQERSSPRGDIFFTTDAAGIEQLRQDGLMEPYRSPNAAKVPDEFKAADGGWTGAIGRSRNFMVNTELLGVDQAPHSIFELTDPKWKGKLAMASIKEGGVRLWLAWLIQELGEEKTIEFMDGLKANEIEVLANHSEVANAVARGEFPIGILNHYYYVPMAREGKPVALIYPDQGPDEMGTLVIPLAVGIVKGAQHLDTAKAFVDFALSPEGQVPLTTQENEFPLSAGTSLGAAAAPGVLSIDQIKRPTVDFSALAAAEKRAVELFTPMLSG
jgi:iron(III) transport system substrate-binding protein